ncbi:MAG: hypothetical protein FJZ01_13560 [Candidatus Sericytochromatia bacterium]|nr:hypothetical protein [Candidatus Tanganyikabacteria bacterium]
MRKLLATACAAALAAGCQALPAGPADGPVAGRLRGPEAGWPLQAKTGQAEGAAAVPAGAPSLTGMVDFGPPAGRFRGQALITEVANAATVSLIDAVAGNTVASSVTEASGAFVLTFGSFTPQANTTYMIEAVKGLAMGGAPNRPGAAVVRVRTLLLWDGGWKSLTNTTPGVGINVSLATTAIATIVSLKQSAGQSVALASLIGKVSGATFADAGTGLGATTDFAPVLTLVSNALTLDQDPVGSVAFDASKGQYRLTTGAPIVLAHSPAIPVPGGTLTLKGANFDAVVGRGTYFFGAVPAATWSVSADRTTATVAIPASAYSAPVTLMQPGGVRQTLVGFLKLKGTVGTLAGDGTAGFRDGEGTQARFNFPLRLAFDAAGNAYVADHWNHRIRKITPQGMVSTYAGTTEGFSNGSVATAQFDNPYGVGVDAAGNVYVADWQNHCIRKIGTDGQVTTAAGGPDLPDFVDGPAASARFNSPFSVNVNANGDLIVADRGNARVRKISGGNVTTLASGLSPMAGAVWADAAGNAYATTSDNSVGSINNRIWRITAAGAASLLAGSATGAAGYADGSGTGALFSEPYDLSVDAAGNAIVADLRNYRIRRVTPAGVASTITGDVAGFRDGNYGSALFEAPFGVTVHPDGSLYICDGQRIRVVTP